VEDESEEKVVSEQERIEVMVSYNEMEHNLSVDPIMLDQTTSFYTTCPVYMKLR
jgi:hypothetical protein